MTSVCLLLVSGMLALSGAILFISPPGRVANWSDWRLAGLTKHDWTDLHVGFAAVFVLGTLAHVVFNIRPLVDYFKSRLTRRPAFRWEWVGALVLCGVVFAGTRAGWPPFSALLRVGEEAKRSWEDPRASAPIPHAELLTLRELAEQARVPCETAVERLEARGCKGVQPDAVVAELAATNGLTPQRLFEIIAAERGRGSGGGRREGSMDRGGGGMREGGGGRGGGGGGYGGGGGRSAGAGRQTLSEYCAEGQIEVPKALELLRARGIKASPEQSLRDIATGNGFDRPFDLLEILRTLRTPQ